MRSCSTIFTSHKQHQTRPHFHSFSYFSGPSHLHFQTQYCNIFSQHKQKHLQSTFSADPHARGHYFTSISLQFHFKHFNFSFLTSNSIIYHIPLPRRGNGIWYMMVEVIEVIEVKYNSLQFIFVLRCWSDRARESGLGLKSGAKVWSCEKLRKVEKCCFRRSE